MPVASWPAHAGRRPRPPSTSGVRVSSKRSRIAPTRRISPRRSTTSVRGGGHGRRGLGQGGQLREPALRPRRRTAQARHHSGRSHARGRRASVGHRSENSRDVARTKRHIHGTSLARRALPRSCPGASVWAGTAPRPGHDRSTTRSTRPLFVITRARQRRHTLKRTRLGLNVTGGRVLGHTLRERAHQTRPRQETNQCPPWFPCARVRGLQDADQRVGTELVVAWTDPSSPPGSCPLVGIPACSRSALHRGDRARVGRRLAPQRAPRDGSTDPRACYQSAPASSAAAPPSSPRTPTRSGLAPAGAFPASPSVTATPDGRQGLRRTPARHSRGHPQWNAYAPGVVRPASIAIGPTCPS